MPLVLYFTVKKQMRLSIAHLCGVLYYIDWLMICDNSKCLRLSMVGVYFIYKSSNHKLLILVLVDHEYNMRYHAKI